MTQVDTDTLAGLREELRLIGCHQNGDARCTCAIGADALDAIDALRAQAAKDKARIERLEARLAAAEAGEDALAEAARGVETIVEDQVDDTLYLPGFVDNGLARLRAALAAYEARRKG